MTRMVVARNGYGPLHIAEPDGPTLHAICGRTLRGDKITTWKAGRPAAAVWREWRRCATCVSLERMWGR